jgi:hypothetical protein
MATITLDIPPSYVPRLLEAITAVWPIPRIPNPEYQSNPTPILDDPSANPSNGIDTYHYDYDFDTPKLINQYSDVAWVKIKIRDFLHNTLERYETRRDINIAKEAIDIPDDLVS